MGMAGSGRGTCGHGPQACPEIADRRTLFNERMETFILRSSWPLTPCFWSRAIPQATFESPPDEPIRSPVFSPLDRVLQSKLAVGNVPQRHRDLCLHPHGAVEAPGSQDDDPG